MSNPYLIGANQAALGSNSLAISVATGTTGGDVIHVAANTSSTGQTVTGVTDSKGNTYAVINSDTSQSTIAEYETTNSPTNALTTADTVTIAYSGTAGAKTGVVTGIPGVTSGHDVAPTPVAASSGTTVSISSGVLSQANEVLIAAVVIGAQANGPTWPAGWTFVGSARQASNPWLSVAYKVVSSTSSSSVAPTWTASVKNVIVLTSFKIPATPPPSGMGLVGQASSASGTTTLSIPITNDTNQGDTLTAGVIATAGSVTGVTDTSGNSYALQVSETANTGDQLYVFESYNSSPLTAAGAPNPKAGLVGATTDYRSYQFATSAPAANAASGCVFTQDGPNPGVTHGPANGAKLQITAGTPPTGFVLNTDYYVVGNPNKTISFKLAATPGGTPIGSASGNGTALTLQYGTLSELGAGSYSDSVFQEFAGFTGNLATGPTGSQKIYFNPGVFSQSFTSSNGQSLSALAATGVQFWINIKPNPDGSDATAVQNMINWWITNGTNVFGNKLKVVLHQEYGNLSDADFIKCYRNYYSTIHALGAAPGQVKVVYNAAGSQKSRWLTAYPGNAFCDEIAIDFYGSVWNAQTKGGTTNLDPVSTMRNLADQNGKPFGFGELGQAVWNAGAKLSDSLFIPYINYIINMMGQHLQDGFANSDVMWYSSYHGANGNCIQNGDWRLQYLTQLYNTLTAQGPGSITATYSGTTSGKAAIVIRDTGVQPGADKAVGATNTTGTTASVATGGLAQSAEHIIAFFTDLNAGGSPVLGDGLTAASTGLAAGTGGPIIKGGFKAVSTAASDTPSATIVSTNWSAAAITHKLNVPVILGSPGDGVVGQAFSFTAQSTGGTGALTWTETGALPAGLSFSSAGVLTGTPTTPGSYSYTIIVTDSLGLQGTLSVTQTIDPVGGGGGGGTPGGPAPLTVLPNNIISLADASAESALSYTWQPYTNASTPVRDSTVRVDGGNATMWQTLTAGDTRISTGLYSVKGGLPYITSGYLFGNQNLQADIGIAWYDSTQTLIATVSEGGLHGLVSNGWTPLNFATSAPQNAAYAAVVFTVLAASQGQTFWSDLVYLAQAKMQILIDWNNPTYALGSQAGQLFADVSPFTRLDLGVNYTRGRQDAVSQVQPGSASFSLQNDIGSFTKLSNTSLPAAIGGSVSLQKRAQINVADENGAWWTRYDGAVSQIDYGFDPTGNTSLAQVSLTDVLSGLNRQHPLFSWTKEQVLKDGPAFHWSLDDPGNTGGSGVAATGAYGHAAETAGANGPPLRLFNTDSTNVATINWQDTSGGIETLANAVRVNAPDGSEFWSPGLNQPSSPLRGKDSNTVGAFSQPQSGIYLTPVITAIGGGQNQFVGNNGYYLNAELPVVLTPSNPSNGYAFECWFTMDSFIGAHLSANYGPYIQLSLGSTRQRATLVAGLFLNAGSLQYKVANYNQPPSFLGLNWPGTAPPTALSSNAVTIPPDTAKIPHHLVLNVIGQSGGGLVEVFLDGVFNGTLTLQAGQVFDNVTVGSAFGGAGAHFGGIQLVSVYEAPMSQEQIILHAQLGQYGMWEQPADDVLTQVASYTSLPTFWTNLSAQHGGLTMTDYMDITGSNALTAMQLLAQTENGLLFVDANGALNFHTRDWRMGHGAPDLLLPPGSYSPELSMSVVDQFMTNEMGVASSGTRGATGQQGAVISTTDGGIDQPTDVVASANTQTGFVNTDSQNKYGIYSPSPVSSPLSLPLITWSRAYAQLGIPSFSYWPDPNLIDVAAWNANSRAEPWTFPASLLIDLQTIDPSWTVSITDSEGNVIQVPVGVSTFYNLEIDDMIGPDTSQILPESLPTDNGSMEWFIEGISEDWTENSHSIRYYVSPAETQRAWLPGDTDYGVLGSTTRIGISQSDLSTPQADGKDVSHDAGPPYWPPTFSNAMNNPSGTSNGFVGAQDMRGIVEGLNLVLTPPMCIVSAVSQAQSFGTGALSNPSLNWDQVHVDTEGGMGLLPGWPNWYVCTVPGFYEISGSLVWALTTAQAGYSGQAWIAVAQSAAQALAAGTGTPLTVAKYVCPVGETTRWNSASMTPVANVTTRMYLGLGDMVALCGEHNYTSSRSSSTGSIGSHMSIRFVGLATADDRTQINSALNNGGTVTMVTTGTPTTFTYKNLHTYSYQGKKGWSPYARRNTDQNCYQGTKGGGTDSEGSQTSQVVFNTSLIVSQLTGKTISSVTLKANNQISWYKTGTKLMLGWTTQAAGQTSYQPANATDNLDIVHQKFTPNQTLTFAIPQSILQAIVTGGATALVLGDSTTTNLDYYGAWNGGPNAWTLTVKAQ